MKSVNSPDGGGLANARCRIGLGGSSGTSDEPGGRDTGARELIYGKAPGGGGTGCIRCRLNKVYFRLVSAFIPLGNSIRSYDHACPENGKEHGSGRRTSIASRLPSPSPTIAHPCFPSLGIVRPSSNRSRALERDTVEGDPKRCIAVRAGIRTSGSTFDMQLVVTT